MPFNEGIVNMWRYVNKYSAIVYRLQKKKISNQLISNNWMQVSLHLIPKFLSEKKKS